MMWREEGEGHTLRKYPPKTSHKESIPSPTQFRSLPPQFLLRLPETAHRGGRCRLIHRGGGVITSFWGWRGGSRQANNIYPPSLAMQGAGNVIKAQSPTGEKKGGLPLTTNHPNQPGDLR